MQAKCCASPSPRRSRKSGCWGSSRLHHHLPSLKLGAPAWLVRGSCRLIPRHERLVTVEDTIELDPGLVNVVRLESQPPSIEGAGQVSLQQLVRAALRLRPDRLVVGEVRGAEVLDMLEAMTTGHDGSLTTCHANSARDAVDRLAALVVRHHHGWSITDARNLVRLAIGAVIHVERDVTGIRKIAEIHPVSPS